MALLPFISRPSSMSRKVTYRHALSRGGTCVVLSRLLLAMPVGVASFTFLCIWMMVASLHVCWFSFYAMASAFGWAHAWLSPASPAHRSDSLLSVLAHEKAKQSWTWRLLRCVYMEAYTGAYRASGYLIRKVICFITPIISYKEAEKPAVSLPDTLSCSVCSDDSSKCLAASSSSSRSHSLDISDDEQTAVRTKDSSDGTPLDRCPAATACTPAAPLTEGHEQEQQQENADDDDADYSQEQLAATPGLLALADQAVCEALWGSDSDTDGTCTRAQPAAALQPHASTSSTTSQGLPPPPRVGTLPAAHTQALTQRVTRRLYRARAYAHYPDSLYELMLCSLGRAAALPPAMRCQDPALQLAAWSAYEFMGRRESLHGLHRALCATSCLAGLKDAVMDACSSTWYHQEVCATYASRVQAELSAAAADTAQAACTSIMGLQAALADTPLLHDTHSTQRPAAAVAVQAPVCRSWADMLDDEDEFGEQQQAAAVLAAARDMEASTAAAAVTTHTVTAVVSSCTPSAPDPASSSNSSLPRWLQPIAVGESWADIVDEEEEWQ